MKIALIGSRGVPARYGGFETFTEELGKKLVERGHQVWVYCRSGLYESKDEEYLGMNLLYFRALDIRFFETLSHTFLSLLHASRKDYDMMLVVNNANSPLLIIPKIFRKKVILHWDGLEWKREKWNWLGTRYYKFTEWLATKLRIDLISDSQEIQKYIQEKYGKDSHFIAYGAALNHCQESSRITQFGLEPDEYFLMVTRFEPENNPLLAIQAFESLNTDKKLVLVGGSRYKTDYSEQIYATQDKRVRLLGFLYEKEILQELLCNCYAYIHGNEVGGTNPALLEAMASGCFVIAREVAFNQEVLQDAGLYFQKDTHDLKDKLSWCVQNPDKMQPYKSKAKEIIQNSYNWEAVVTAYEELFQNTLDKK